MWFLVSFLWGARYQTMHELLPLSYILSFSFCESMASLHSAGSPQILKFSCLSIWSVGITYVSWSLHYKMAQISYRGMCSHHLHPGSEPRTSVIKCFCLIVLVGFFVCFQNDPEESSKIHKGENVYNFIVNKVDMTWCLPKTEVKKTKHLLYNAVLAELRSEARPPSYLVCQPRWGKWKSMLGIAMSITSPIF